MAMMVTLAPIAAARGQQGTVRSTPLDSSLAAPPRVDTLPFVFGEKLDYAISYGRLHIGHGSMELEAGDTIRGRPTYHATFRLGGGTFLFHVADVIESWFDPVELASLRFRQEINEGRYHAHRDFQIFPDARQYRPYNDSVRASVAQPLDDASFLYFVRALQLTVGAQYTFDRYFQPAGNPIVLRVLRTERISVPAGTFDAVVVQPSFSTSGIFSQQGHAEIWIRTDGAHEVLQMKSHLAFGSIDLYLVKIAAWPTEPGAMHEH